MENVIARELVFINKEFNHTDEYFEFMYTVLHEKGYVKSTFLDAIKKREMNFPTGLPVAGEPIAIPHCEAENINKSFIAVSRLKRPIEFTEIGTVNGKLNIRIVYMLGLKAHDGEQVELLQKLIEAFLKEGYAEGILNAATEDELYKYVISNTEV